MMTDRRHWLRTILCCILDSDNKTVYMTWPSKVNQGYRQCHPSLDRLDFISEAERPENLAALIFRQNRWNDLESKLRSLAIG